MIILSEVRERQYHMLPLTWDLKSDTNGEHLQDRNRHTDIKTNWLLMGKGEGRNLKLGINRCTLLYKKQITNKDPLYSTGDHTKYLVMTYDGKESEKECIQIYI